MKTNNKTEQKQEKAIFYEAEKLPEDSLILNSITDESTNLEKSSLLKSMMLQAKDDESQTITNEKIKPVDINDPEDMFDCGITNYYFEDYQKAIEYFNRSLEIMPEQSEVVYYKALSYACMGEFKKAIIIIDKAIDLDSKNSHYWNDKGAFLTELNQVSKAHRCFNKSIRLKSNSYNWANKAALHHKCNELEEALECYDKAIKLDGNDIYPVVGKAKVYMELNDFDSADEYFELAQSIDDTDLEFLIERGKYMMFKQDYRQALRYFDKCIRFNNGLSYVWMFKAMVLKHLKRIPEAEHCVDRAVELDSEILSQFNEFF